MPPKRSRKRAAEEPEPAEQSTEKQQIASLKKELTAEKKETKELRKKLTVSEKIAETHRDIIAELRLKAAMEETLRSTMTSERKEMEQRHAQERLQSQQVRVKLEKSLEESQKKLQGRVDDEVKQKFGKDLQKEIDNTAYYRKELLQLAKHLQEEKEDDGVEYYWKKCEKCSESFTGSGKRIPRVLGCGHTFCEECIKKMCKSKKLICPADNQEHALTQATVKSLPINKLALTM